VDRAGPTAILDTLGGVPERSKGADCKSAGSAFAGSNPAPATRATAGRGDSRRVAIAASVRGERPLRSVLEPLDATGGGCQGSRSDTGPVREEDGFVVVGWNRVNGTR
jgi:hypothetical protein